MKQTALTASVATERQSIKVAFITGIMSLTLALLYFADQTPPLFGRYSVGLATALLAAITTFILFIVGWRMPNVAKAKNRALRTTAYWGKRSAVAFVHATLVFLLLSALFYLLQHAFKGLELNAVAASVIVALSVACISYMVYPLVATLTLANLSVILAVFLGVGVLTSAMSMQDPTWWQFHFSALGAGNPLSAWAFNVTLIIAGIVVVAITELIAVDLKRIAKEKGATSTRGIDTLRVMLSLTGVALACVGIFPFDDFLTIHNIAASGMAVIFISMIISLKKLVPFFDPSFYVASFSMLFAILVTVGLFIFQYFNLTALELVAAGVIFSWFIMFIRQISTFQPTKEIQY